MEKWKDRREFIFSYLCLIGTPTMNLMIKSHHECERREHNFSCSFYYGDGWNFFFFFPYVLLVEEDLLRIRDIEQKRE